MIRLNAILLILTLSAPFVFKSAVVGHYLLNQRYYATELCVNKDNVEKNCNGMCQLNQELSDDGSRDSQAPEQMPNTELSSFLIPDCFLEKVKDFDLSIKLVSYAPFDELADFISKLDKPPTNLC